MRWCTHSSAAHVWVTLWSLSYRLWLCFIRNVCHLIASVEVCVNINRWCSGLCCCCRLRVADLVEIADPPLSFCCCCKACCTDGCLDRCLTGFSLVWRDLGWTPWLCFLLVTAVLWSWGFDIKTYKYICIFMCVYIYINMWFIFQNSELFLQLGCYIWWILHIDLTSKIRLISCDHDDAFFSRRLPFFKFPL